MTDLPVKLRHGCFVTGTDTGVGKTLVSTALLQALKQRGYTVNAMKPVASGCTRTSQGLRNDDAQRLLSHSNTDEAYSLINPYAFEPPLSPDIAARIAGKSVDLEIIQQHYAQLNSRVDFTVVEGVGGWRVPLNEHQSVSDLALVLDVPVILVVGLRLGCINHALLTAQAMVNDGAPLLGMLGSQIDASYACIEETMQAISRHTDRPWLGYIPWHGAPTVLTVSSYLNSCVDSLLETYALNVVSQQ